MSGVDPRQRMDELEIAISDYPAQVAAARERVTAVRDRLVTGQDQGGLVSVEVTAAGVVTGVRISARALGDIDDRRLAECVRDAVNDALGRAEEVLAAAIGTAGAQDDAEARFAAFESRMQGVEESLDRIGRSVDRLDG
ncbi:YbaB/EbfC family nucleoid-associated protein [Actinoplanes sp. NPDC051494]|uniref:YbaB/EbfC family nucleoid-associated protein n=1 Tax=Actinoplanes sp. NPDC051494 TaxID=3363907 RepID=UPI00378EA7DC